MSPWESRALCIAPKLCGHTLRGPKLCGAQIEWSKTPQSQFAFNICPAEFCTPQSAPSGVLAPQSVPPQSLGAMQLVPRFLMELIVRGAKITTKIIQKFDFPFLRFFLYTTFISELYTYNMTIFKENIFHGMVPLSKGNIIKKKTRIRET